MGSLVFNFDLYHSKCSEVSIQCWFNIESILNEISFKIKIWLDVLNLYWKFPACTTLSLNYSCFSNLFTFWFNELKLDTSFYFQTFHNISKPFFVFKIPSISLINHPNFPHINWKQSKLFKSNQSQITSHLHLHLTL